MVIHFISVLLLLIHPQQLTCLPSNTYQMKLLILSTLIAIISLLLLSNFTEQHYEEAVEFIGYDKDVAGYAINYASCSGVQTSLRHLITSWSYGPCLLAQNKSHVKDISVITKEDTYLLAFTAYDALRNIVVVSFRATVFNSSNNIKMDGDFIPTNYVNTHIGGNCQRNIMPGKHRCNAHAGFYSGYEQVKGKVRINTLDLLEKYKSQGPKVLVTGYSLGAALASFAIVDLATYFKFHGMNTTILAYTFGQPRIGNHKFIQQIDSIITIYRIVHRADPVPHLPPRQILEQHYYNPGVEVFYESAQDKQPYFCVGDGSHCSFSKAQSLQLCDHFAYPDITYNQAVNFQANTSAIYNISISDTLTELERVGSFLLTMARIMSSGKLPICHAEPSPVHQLKYHKQPSHFQALMSDMFSFISSELLVRNQNATAKSGQSGCHYWICDKDNLKQWFKGTIRTPGRQEDQL